MLRKILIVSTASLALGACATSGSTFHVDASNSPSQCASEMAQGKVPMSQQHGYMQRCTAGYRAAQDSDAAGDTFTLPPPPKDTQGD